MSILFVHDGKIGEYKNKLYSKVYNDDIIKKYKNIDKKVIFLTRDESILNLTNKDELLDSKLFESIRVKNYNSFRFIKNINNAKKIIKNAIENSDYIICRLPSILGNIAVKYAKKYNKKYLIELVGCPWDALWNHSFLGKLVAPYMYLKTKSIIKKAKYVVYVSEEFLQKRYPTKGRTIGCSDVIIKSLDKEKLNSRITKIENLNSMSLTIGTIGPVDIKYKGQKYVIKAISELNKLGYNFKCQLVGGGNKEKLQEFAKKLKIEKNIEFLGFKHHESISEWLEDIDIYIQPSTTEGICRAIIEAMSVACPVIASNAGGNPELLDSKYIFPKKKYKKLILILQEFNKMDLKQQAEKNFNVSKKFIKENLDKHLKDFYNNFINS